MDLSPASDRPLDRLRRGARVGERLQEALADPQTRDEALEIQRSLVERVVMHPAEGGFEIELVGKIANMVSLGTSSGPFKRIRKLPLPGRLFVVNSAVR